MVEKIIVFILIIILTLFNYIFPNENLNGIYIISSIKNNNKLAEGYFSKATFNNFYSNKYSTKYFFDIIPLNSNVYNIVSKTSNQLLSLDDKNNVILINKNNNINIFWNIIKIKGDEYLIQNKKTKNYLEINYNLPKCFRKLSNLSYIFPTCKNH